MSRVRYVIGSLIAPIAALAIPALLAIHEIYSEPALLANGEVDDAPMRGAGLFLLIGVPTLVLIGSCFYALMGHLLSKAGRMSLRSWLVLTSTAPWLFIAALALLAASNSGFSLTGLFITSIVGIGASLCATIGALVWRRIIFSSGKRQSNEP